MESLENILPETGSLAYLAYMAERLAFCRELLKDTGSIYLHCDPTMSHYLKLVMDAVFGRNNFRNEISWKRTISDQKGSQHAPKQWGNNTDIIFFYTKSDNYKLKPHRPLTKEEIEAKFNKTDEKGRKYRDDSSSLFRAKSMGPRPNLCYEWKGFRNPSPAGWRLCKERLEEEFQKGNIVIREDGKLERRQYPEDYRGFKPGNFWGDVPPATGKERRGFEIQKPLALLKRIIQASTNKGDVVFDPFCGCGTTVVAAHQLKRQFVGIDISLYHVQNVVRKWLTEVGLTREQIHIAGIPEDMAQVRQLAEDDPFAFESFAVELCHPGFKANVHQRKDGGIDGKGVLLHPILDEDGETKNIVIVQCKAGKPNIDQVMAFDNRIKRIPRVIAGVFITLESAKKGHWTSEMRKIASQAGKFKEAGSARKFPRLQHWHCSQANLRNREETLFEGLPNLPDLAHRDGKALRKVEISVQQSDFWKGTEE